MRLSMIVATASLLLAACAPGAAPRPVSAVLLADRLSVTFSDGATCKAAADFAGNLREGVLAGCPHAVRYSVDATARPNPVSALIAGFLTALDLGDTLSPQATVTLTGADGRVTVFVSPAAID